LLGGFSVFGRKSAGFNEHLLRQVHN
jgi:hypothetical protein